MHLSSHTSHAVPFSEWIPLLIIAAGAAVYLYATLRLHNRKGGWSHWRTLSFLFGILLLAVAMLPSLMQWAHHDLRGHMAQHLLIGMYGPLFLVLGAPITLALIALPVEIARGVTAVLRSKIFYFLSHPVIALLLNMGGMYLLYLSPLYVMSLSNSYLHYLIHIHFLVAGYLFAWSIIGQEPVSKRPAFKVRLLVLFISITAHAFLSKFMYAYLYPLHSPHPGSQIQEAARMMYYWGDLSELLLAIVLFGMWYHKKNASRSTEPLQLWH